MEFKDKIKTRRQELGMTLEELAAKVGVRAATVSRWESGEIKNVRRDKIKLLADALQVSAAYLMDWDETPPAPPTAPQIKDVYLRFAQQAQDEGISPKDIQTALDMIKKLRGE